MPLIEIILIVAFGIAIFFASRYIVIQHKKHGCVGCSQAKNCHHSWKNCVKQNNRDKLKS